MKCYRIQNGRGQKENRGLTRAFQPLYRAVFGIRRESLDLKLTFDTVNQMITDHPSSTWRKLFKLAVKMCDGFEEATKTISLFAMVVDALEHVHRSAAASDFKIMF